MYTVILVRTLLAILLITVQFILTFHVLPTAMGVFVVIVDRDKSLENNDCSTCLPYYFTVVKSNHDDEIIVLFCSKINPKRVETYHREGHILVFEGMVMLEKISSKY